MPIESWIVWTSLRPRTRLKNFCLTRERCDRVGAILSLSSAFPFCTKVLCHSSSDNVRVSSCVAPLTASAKVFVRTTMRALTVERRDNVSVSSVPAVDAVSYLSRRLSLVILAEDTLCLNQSPRTSSRPWTRLTKAAINSVSCV